MKRFATVLAAASLFTVVATSAFAQVGSRPQMSSDMVAPDKGTAEIGLSLDATLHQNGGGHSQDLNVKFLPYITKNIQVGGAVNYDHESGDGFHSTSTGIEVQADYNFLNPNAVAVSRTVPYIGLAVGTAHQSATDEDSQNVASYGAQGGVKHFISNDVSVFAELNYRHYNKGFGNNTALLVGLNTYLRK